MGAKDQRAISSSTMRSVAARAACNASASDSTTIHASAGASGLTRFRRLEQRSGEWLLAVDTKAQRHFRRALDAVDADFAVALGSVRVPGRKQGARVQYRQVERGSGAKLAHVHVAAEGARGAGAELAVFRRGNAHHSAEGTQGHHGWAQRTAYLGVEHPVKEIRLTKLLLKETEPGDHARPTPAQVLHLQDFNLEHIAGLGAVDPDGAGQGMNPAPVNGQKIFHARARRYLTAAGVEAAHVYRVSG